MKSPLLFALILVQSEYTCTVPITNWSYEAVSPVGHARVVVRNLGLKPHRLEMRISVTGKTRTVFSRDYGELQVGFCELHWTPDSRIVEMFATNPIEGAEAVFAFDIVGNHIVDSAWAAGDLRRSIAREYSLKPSTDPFRWRIRLKLASHSMRGATRIGARSPARLLQPVW